MSFFSRISRPTLNVFQRQSARQVPFLACERNRVLLNAARASRGESAQPAQAAFTLGVVMIPAGTLAGVAYLCTKLGVGDTWLYRQFEDKIVEKQMLRRMSSIGKEKAKKKRETELAMLEKSKSAQGDSVAVKA